MPGENEQQTEETTVWIEAQSSQTCRCTSSRSHVHTSADSQNPLTGQTSLVQLCLCCTGKYPDYHALVTVRRKLQSSSPQANPFFTTESALHRTGPQVCRSEFRPRLDSAISHTSYLIRQLHRIHGAGLCPPVSKVRL